MNKSVFGAIILFIFSISFTACITGRKAVRHKAVADTTVAVKQVDTAIATIAPAPAVMTNDKKQLIDSIAPLWQKHFTYKTFVGKAKMSYDGGGNSQEFTANFRIKKDSIIWIAVTALGGMVQVARVYVTPDSFYLVNYLQKEAYRMPISQAAKLLPVSVDFATIQNLVVGEALRSGGNITDATDSAGLWQIQVEGNDYVQQLTYIKADSTMLSGLLRMRGTGGVRGAIQYSNYAPIDGRLFSMGRDINIQNAGDQYALSMHFTVAGFDQPLEYPFSIPRSYTIK